MRIMLRSAIAATLLLASFVVPTVSSAQPSKWKKQADRVTIMRDQYGIAHVYGKSDADAVFGMVYAQAEDDFSRVETNYITAMGRTSEVDGEGALWRDLRMKLFIDPAELKAQYAASPAWLKSLSTAWAALWTMAADSPSKLHRATSTTSVRVTASRSMVRA